MLEVSSSTSATVTVSAEGDFADFVDSVSTGRGGDTEQMAVGQRERVAIKLKVPKDKEPADYHGTILVETDDGFSVAIPALITVLDKGETPDAAPTLLAPSPVEPDTGDTGVPAGDGLPPPPRPLPRSR